MDLANSTMVWLILSASPFCCGLKGALVCCTIPCSLKKLRNCLLMYSVPLSLRRHSSRSPVCFSTRFFYSTKLLNTWAFDDSRNTCTYLDKSSINVTTKRSSHLEVVRIGLITSECTSSSNFVVLTVLPD
ncbi:hypothetical protein Plhal703r1_c30g0118581 [Plasmopara halstedii]